MIEYPIQNYCNIQRAPQIHQGGIKSEFYEGTKEEFYSSYMCYRFLYEVGKLCTSQTNIDNILDVLLNRLVELTNAERCLILLFDAQNRIIFQAGGNLNLEEIYDSAFSAGWFIINKVRQTNAAIYYKNAFENDEFKSLKSNLPQKILTVICLPILHEGRSIGVLYADNRSALGVFKKDICYLLRQFIDLICDHLACIQRRTEQKNHTIDLQSHIESRAKYQFIIGNSPQVQQVLKFIDQASDTTATVLIEGESGTGKDLVARALHENSRRRGKPFVPLNCSTFTETLLESELFGHVKGSFTGAYRNQKGWFEVADGGSIFFDEISEMSPGIQAKLLRILQRGEFSPLGSREIRTSEIRVIAATNKNLKTQVHAGRFRPDLYYRLNILYLYIPSLRERREDIPLLVNYYLQKYGKKEGKEGLILSPAVYDLLMNYDYPGNVRELENAMQRIAVMIEGTEVQLQHLPDAFHPQPSSNVLASPGRFKDVKRAALERLEKDYIENVLKNSHGVIAHAAKIAGMNAKNFYQKMMKYKITSSTFKS